VIGFESLDETAAKGAEAAALAAAEQLAAEQLAAEQLAAEQLAADEAPVIDHANSRIFFTERYVVV